MAALSYIAGIFSCSRDTVSLSIKELAEEESLAEGRSRKKGGERTPVLKKTDINDVFLALLKEHK